MHAAAHEVSTTEPSPFGLRFVVEGPIQAPDGRTPLIRVVWFVQMGQQVPRLATAYPLATPRIVT